MDAQGLQNTGPRWGAADEGVIVCDDAGRIIEVNERACALTGYDAEELLARGFCVLATRLDPFGAGRCLETLEGEATLVVQTDLRRKDGTARPVSLRVSSSLTPGRRQAVVRLRHRGRAAEVLPQDESFVTAVLDAAEYIVVVLDRRGRIVLWNRTCERIFGHTFGDVRGKAFRDVLRAPVEFGTSSAGEADWITRAGARRRIAWTLRALDQHGGPPRYMVLTGTDRTGLPTLDPREAAEDVRRVKAELEERVRQRTAELEAALAEMESFTHAVAHDLRAPVRALHGLSDILLDDFADQPLNAEGRGYLQRIRDVSDRMDRLMADLLTYSRLGREEVPREPVETLSLVCETLTLMAETLKNREAHIDIEEGGATVLANRALLSQMLMNLISNAIKFVAPGVTPSIRIFAERHPGRVRLSVSDNGIGIAPEYLERIFGVFQRLNRQEDYPGNGLGLALVRRAATRLGGRVGVQSTPGKGSTFWIEFPEA
jgi:PAS domain S-box-containing protein